MTRLLVVEPGYCPYQAAFTSAAAAVSEVIDGESQILKPFGTPRIGLICSKTQSRLKYNRQINDEGMTVRGRFLISHEEFARLLAANPKNAARSAPEKPSQQAQPEEAVEPIDGEIIEEPSPFVAQVMADVERLSAEDEPYHREPIT